MPTRERPSPAAKVRAHPRLTASAVALAVALVVVTLLGGWARSTPEGAVQVAAGTEVEAAPFRVTLEEASARFALYGTDAEPGQAFVVVEGRIELTGRESVTSTTLADALTADLTDSYDQYGSPTEVPVAGVRVLDDGSSLLGLGPGLRYDVSITFVVDEQAVPGELTVTVLEHVRRPNAIDGEPGWYDPAPAARVRLDVAPLPPTRPEPESLW